MRTFLFAVPLDSACEGAIVVAALFQVDIVLPRGRPPGSPEAMPLESNVRLLLDAFGQPPSSAICFVGSVELDRARQIQTGRTTAKMREKQIADDGW